MDKYEIEKNIKNIIKRIEDKFNDIYIGFNYLPDSEAYEIWHNREDLEYESPEFKRFTGKLLYDIFLSKGIYNVFISYDYENETRFPD